MTIKENSNTNCPSCGAPYALGLTTCAYCNTPTLDSVTLERELKNGKEKKVKIEVGGEDIYIALSFNNEKPSFKAHFSGQIGRGIVIISANSFLCETLEEAADFIKQALEKAVETGESSRVLKDGRWIIAYAHVKQ